jgi:hypothetical protein
MSVSYIPPQGMKNLFWEKMNFSELFFFKRYAHTSQVLQYGQDRTALDCWNVQVYYSISQETEFDRGVHFVGYHKF